MICLAWVPPKVLRKMVEIWYVVVDWTNLQLIVLKILSGVSCDEKDVVGIRWKICSWVFRLWIENGHQKYFVRWLRFDVLWVVVLLLKNSVRGFL